MALTRRIKKLNSSMAAKISGRLILTCKECNKISVEVPADIAYVTCAYCVQKMVAPPDNYVKKVDPADKKPKGWHFKMYFEHNGVVYSKGKVVTDAKQIAALKNMDKTPTPKKVVKAKKKPSTKRKKNARATK